MNGDDRHSWTDVPAPPAPARRTPWKRVVIAGLIGVFLTLFLTSDLARNVARGVGQWAAGVGKLEWRSAEGWQAISAAQASRRTWRTGDAFLAPTWDPAEAGLDLAVLAFRRPPNPLVVEVLLARIDPAAWRFRVWGRPDYRPGNVAELTEEAGLTFAVNASYFSAEGPLGLVVSDGAARGRQGKNRAAHFVVEADGAPRIVNGKGAPLGALDQGFQGFPSIMTGGRTYAYMRYGGRGFDVWTVDRRTAGCVLGDGRVVLLATDTVTNGLSLDELATVLGGLGCVDAMAFDGGSSTGLALYGAAPRTITNLAPVPVILGVQPR